MIELTKLHKELSKHYKVFKVTSAIDEDLKLIKKINILFEKLSKSNDPTGYLGIINIFTILGNNLKIEEMQEIFLELIDFKYHQATLYLIHNYKNTNTKSLVENL